MRKIDRLARDAFLQGVEFKLSNTEVKIENGFVTMFLFDNPIARRPVGSFGTLEVSLGGYKVSNTTNSRLSALPNVIASIRKGEPFLNGEPWDGDWTVINNGE